MPIIVLSVRASDEDKAKLLESGADDCVVMHNTLMKEVLGVRHVDSSHYLRILVRPLRGKIEQDPKRPQVLVSELGVGYRLTSGIDGR